MNRSPRPGAFHSAGFDFRIPASRNEDLLGNYPVLGRAAHAAILHSELVELDGLGDLPHIEAFDRFFPPYREFIDHQTAAATQK